MANNSIDLVSLDFNTHLNSLRNFLRDNEQFKDYDYDGANIRLLLELLAVNSSKTAFYQNMVHNESFLDSAVLRNSALSRAKELNYLPNSAKSSRARIKVTFTADGTSAPYIVPKGALLTSLVKNDSYTFSIPETITVASPNTSYEFETDIFEGYFLTDTYTFLPGVDSSAQRFEIKNKNVDIDSLTVTVYEDGNQVGDKYNLASTLLDLDGNSKVFFLQPSEHGYFEVIFGNGIHGRQPKGNSTLVLNYRISSGSEANGTRLFTLDFDPTGSNELTGTATVSTLQESKDGAEAETLDSIKFNAPRHFQVQERAVNDPDYSVILKKKFPEINAIHTYGGEKLRPRRYGKVYCAVDISDVDGLPDSKKAQFAKFLENRTTFGIVPIFVEPEFVYLQVNTKVRYNLNITEASRDTINTLVRDAVVAYKDTYLDDFNVILRRSQLETDIDESDPSIVSSQTEVRSYKKINPTLAKLDDATVDFGAAIRDDFSKKEDNHPASKITAVSSSPFTYNSQEAILEDDGEGIIRIMKVSGSNLEKILDIGTVDYATGKIEIKDIKVDSYLGSAIKIYARMADPDVSASLNNILTIEDDEINVTLEEIRI